MRLPRTILALTFALVACKKSPLSSGPPGDSSWLGFYETRTAPRDGPRLYDRAAIALSLTGPARAFTGQPLALALSLTNGSAQPLHYGMPVDGSFEHWRGPFVDLYARDEARNRTYRWTFGKGFGRCGNVDSRKPEDFVMLPPGKGRADPFGPRSHTALAAVVTRPGRYTLWVAYSSSCVGAELSSGDGFDAKPPDDRFEGTIASNGITLEVTRSRSRARSRSHLRARSRTWSCCGDIVNEKSSRTSLAAPTRSTSKLR